MTKVPQDKNPIEPAGRPFQAVSEERRPGKAVLRHLIVGIVGLASFLLLGSSAIRAADTVALENARLGLRFDPKTGTLTALQNKLTCETYGVSGDTFSVEAVQFRLDFPDFKLTQLKTETGVVRAHYEGPGMTVEVSYTLHGENHFAEKRTVLTASRNLGLKKLVLGRPSFSAPDLTIVPYRYQKNVTYFGRTLKGGIFLGVELPYDQSGQPDAATVSLGYAPSMKVLGGQRVVCEPAYIGVYRKKPGEPDGSQQPLASESEAMLAMTSAILPPHHRRLAPVICGWWSETWRSPYRTQEDVDRDKRAIDFAVDCGIDYISDAKTWAGEVARVNALRKNDSLVLGPLPLKVAEYARRRGVKWMFWATMNHTDPWSEWDRRSANEVGQPFRPDRPDWQMKIPIPTRKRPPQVKVSERELALRGASTSADCFADREFFDWLMAVTFQAMDAGQYGAWCIDGNFFLRPAVYSEPGNMVPPARCTSDAHDHLCPDANYLCERNLTEMARLLRQRYPDLYMFHARPVMDLGVWSLRHVDACFTINEFSRLKGIPGMGPQPKNVLLGDKIRHWSRIRVHQHFFPHYLDSPLVFDGPKSMTKRDWTSEKIDYIMLSALSSSPNQLYYLPTKAGIPDKDKAEIRKWLDWGRKNIDYLMVRRDLPDWPAPGKVDGSAHIVEDRGYVFLFNPNPNALKASFALTEEGMRLKGKGPFRVAQEHPPSDRTVKAAAGQTVHWEVPAHTAVVLRVE